MKTKRYRTALWALAAVTLGVVLRLWFIRHTARIAGDTLIYGDLAKNLLQHGVYGLTVAGGTPRPTLIRLPGYPLFLAGCFWLFGADRYVPVLNLQLLADLATCGLVAGLAGRLFGSRARMAALWLAMLCPFTASYVAAPLTETLTLLCIAAAFYALERWRAAGLGWNIWAGAVAWALGYALLLRPEQALLAVAVLGGMAAMTRGRPGYRRPGLRRAVVRLLPVLAVATGLLLPLVPWTVRNWRTFHVVQPLAPRYATDPGELVPLGFQRWYRTWGIDFASTEAVYWNYDSDPIEPGDLPVRAFDSERQYRETVALLDQYNETTRATAALDQRFEVLAEQRIAADPVRYYLALPAARLVNMLLRPRTEMFEVPLEWWKQPRRGMTRVFAYGYAGLNLAYLVLAGWGLWVWRAKGWGALGWAMVAYAALRCALLLTIDNSEPRYTIELFPMLIVWAGALWGRATNPVAKVSTVRLSKA